MILGFGPQGQMVANMLSSPLAQSGSKPHAYIGFDLDHSLVTASRKAGFNVAYGNGSRGDVLKAAGRRQWKHVYYARGSVPPRIGLLSGMSCDNRQL